MPKIAKAYAITDAKISFVSLVDKAANKKQFLITKSEDGAANFATFGRILKADADSHFVTGIVYEPMVEDTQGNYMTEEEITKAAYWFAKNGNQVDLQHCFKKCDGAEVVESYVAKCDMEIEGETIKKGTWLMTMEITDSDVWDSIQKGDITGFSMGGVGVYSEEDVELPVEKQEEPKGLFRKLAKLRWLMSPKRAQEWELYLMNQVIGKGGAVPENVYTQPVHIPTVSCPSISDDKIVLTDPKNLVVVNTYGMKIRKTNEGKEAIMQDKRFYVCHLDYDPIIEELDATAMITGLPSLD